MGLTGFVDAMNRLQKQTQTQLLLDVVQFLISDSFSSIRIHCGGDTSIMSRGDNKHKTMCTVDKTVL